MRLWLITQEENTGYETYSQAVVSAHSRYKAARIHPNGITLIGTKGCDEEAEWVEDPSKVIVIEIGEANDNVIDEGVVVSQYNDN